MTLLPCEAKVPFEILSMAKRANKKAILLCGSLDPHLERKTQEEFPNHKFIPFAKKFMEIGKKPQAWSQIIQEACRNIFEDLFKGTSLECPIVKEARFKRIRRLKKFLRPLKIQCSPVSSSKVVCGYCIPKIISLVL